MDLSQEAERLRLDVLAVRLSAALHRRGVPHVLLKGPSTATWLYSPPRRYRDVDLLVPLSQVKDAARALGQAGLAWPRSGGVGEEASHAWLLHSAEGFEVDLHVSLPAVPVHDDQVWRAIEAHIEPFEMDVGRVPALDEVGRCLVLTLHAAGDPFSGQPTEDLRRARAITTGDTWRAAASLAALLAADDLFVAGVAAAEGEAVPLSRRSRLYQPGVPEAALGLERLLSAPLREQPGIALRELVPSRGFMAFDAGRTHLEGSQLLAAHVRRWRRLLRQIPIAARFLWRDR